MEMEMKTFICSNDGISNCGGKVGSASLWCDDCIDSYSVCEGCGATIHNDDCVLTDRGNSYCESCYNEWYFRCEGCDDEYRLAHGYEAHGRMYCNDCFCDSFIICEDCEDTVSRDYSYYDDHTGRTYCESCYRDHDRHGPIHSYHHGADIMFRPCPRRDEPIGDKLYLGVELETDGYYDRSGAAENLALISEDEELFYMEEDGSLSNGIEIISQPCTLEFHKSTFPWQSIADIVDKAGGKSHQTETCGLHIHINRSYFGYEYAINALKLMYLFERFWTQFVKFSRRKGNSWVRYAAKYNDDFINCDTESKVIESRNKGRYFAINLTHANTIEFRIFKGTLKVSSIIASLELVDFLARYVKAHSIEDLQSLTWANMVDAIEPEYTYLNEYLVSKHLKGGN